MATPDTARGRASLDAHAAHEDTPRAEAMLTPEHLARLLDLSRALAGACERGEIAVIAAERAHTLTGASATQVLGLRDDGGPLAVIAEATGAAARSRSQPGAIGATGPEHEVVRSGEPLWLRSRAEASERWRDDALAGGPDAASWAFLPLVADDETNGVLALVFDDVQAFDAATRRFLGEVAAASGTALARGSLFTQARARANASDEARAACEVRQRRSDGQLADRTHLYERERFARARAEAETAAAVHAAPGAFVVQYEEVGVDGPMPRFLGVFSSEASALEALRALDRTRSLVVRASISSWTLDAPHPRTSVEIDLQA
jgi:transcriptional regulator with GAF, ATPase, and Fis domain